VNGRSAVPTGALLSVLAFSTLSCSNDWDLSGLGDLFEVVITWEGTVTSAVDGSPINFATVFGYEELADGSVKYVQDPYLGQDTGEDGFYRMARTRCGIPENTFLQAKKFGWQDSERVYVTCKPAVQRVDFVLEPVPPSAATGR